MKERKGPQSPVCLWTGRRWRNVTAMEASLLLSGKALPEGELSSGPSLPEGASLGENLASEAGEMDGKEGDGDGRPFTPIFVCEACRQEVVLADGKKKAPFFKHQRSQGGSCSLKEQEPVRFSLGERGLPIRLRLLEDGKAELQVGLTPLPEGLYEQVRRWSIEIRPQGEKPVRASLESLKRGEVTYLSVGDHLAPRYHLTTSEDPKALPAWWPTEFRGLRGDGVLFDAVTGLMIEEDGDVVCGRVYHLLTSKGRAREREQVRIERVRSFPMGGKAFHLFEIEASAPTADAALLFWAMHARLTERPERIDPLWPPAAREPFGLRLIPGGVSLLCQGDGEVATDPPLGRREDGDLLELDDSGGGEVLLGMGRENLHLQMVLWPWQRRETMLPQAEGLSEGGQVPEGRLALVPSFDGRALLYDNLGLCGSWTLTGGRENVLTGLRPGQELRILAGQDLIRRITLTAGPALNEGAGEEKKEEKAPAPAPETIPGGPEDEELLRRLSLAKGRPVTVPRSALVLARQLGEGTRAGQWLLRAARKGEMTEEAAKVIRGYRLREDRNGMRETQKAVPEKKGSGMREKERREE